VRSEVVRSGSRWDIRARPRFDAIEDVETGTSVRFGPLSIEKSSSATGRVQPLLEGRATELRVWARQQDPGLVGVAVDRVAHSLDP
jgi:hypothetical protein